MKHDPINAHFCQRARERAGVDDPEALFLALCRALREGRHDVVEHCFDLASHQDPDGNPLRSIWRFRVASGAVFYAVVAILTMRPITLITHDQVKFYRAVRRNRRAKGRKGPWVGKA